MIVAGLELTRTIAVALLLQRLAGLGAGIVELAGLADDDRAGADDQDRVDVGALRHGLSERFDAGMKKPRLLSTAAPDGSKGFA